MRWGCTRLVFRVGRWAVKVPNVRYGWAASLRGILHNLAEATMWRCALVDDNEIASMRRYLCPVTYTGPLGLFLIMPWAEQFETHALHPSLITFGTRDERREMLKDDNVGWLDGRWVVLDYAGGRC